MRGVPYTIMKEKIFKHAKVQQSPNFEVQVKPYAFGAYYVNNPSKWIYKKHKQPASMVSCF